MESGVTVKKLHIGGMTCVNCQNKIEKQLRNTTGIKKAEVSYKRATAIVTYDADIISSGDIAAVIRGMDYEAAESPQNTRTNAGRAIGAVLIILALYIILQYFGFTQVFSNFRLAESGMGYWMLFFIGLITSVHCIAMCGGINISQCVGVPPSGTDGKLAAFRPSFLYNLGRVISYTVAGGIVGALGSVFSLSGAFRGVVQIAAGVFMVIMGINMLGILPELKRFAPRIPAIFANKIDKERDRSKSPLYIGLLNGLMPCGPLQAMQLYALSTGSPIAGALSMMLFSLGTVPLMFGLGALSSILTKKFTNKMMTAGAVLVVVLGLSMFTQGWSLSGFSGIPAVTASASGNPADKTGTGIENGTQIINSTLSRRGYPAITVQAGIPVRWIIDAPQSSINGCNYLMFIPEYNLEHTFKPGENVIEFTPTSTGIFRYSCWMGMIRSSITVIDSPSDDTGAAAPPQTPDADGGIGEIYGYGGPDGVFGSGGCCT